MFEYSREMLRWATMPPGFLVDWHVGVRTTTSKKLVGFIAGIPSRIFSSEKEFSACEINFLCVHKKLRLKRLAPVLIKEVTRRVNLTNIWQAVYTAGRLLPKPVSKCTYFHRALDAKKLLEVGFSHLSRTMTLSRAIKLAKLPTVPSLTGLRPFDPKTDAKQVTQLLME